VTQLVLAIISKDTRTTVERWVFDVHLVDQSSAAAGNAAGCVPAFAAVGAGM
jgi:mitotic spindle assembly checkpoint protein MAD2